MRGYTATGGLATKRFTTASEALAFAEWLRRRGHECHTRGSVVRAAWLCEGAIDRLLREYGQEAVRERLWKGRHG